LAYHLPKYIVVCLICTIIVEVLIAFIFKIKSKKDYINIILVNMVTNPLVVVIPYIFYLYIGIYYRYISLLILEVLTILIEGYIYKKTLQINQNKCYKLSLMLNISSYLIGLIINNIIY